MNCALLGHNYVLLDVDSDCQNQFDSQFSFIEFSFS